MVLFLTAGRYISGKYTKKWLNFKTKWYILNNEEEAEHDARFAKDAFRIDRNLWVFME